MVDVANSVLDIIASKATTVPRDKLERSAKLTELGVASLDVVEVVFDLEEKFDIRIPFTASNAKDFQTVGQVIDAVSKLVAEKA